MTAQTPGQASHEARQAAKARRMGVPGREPDSTLVAIIGLRWDELPAGMRADEEAGAQAAISWQRAEDVNPTAEDYDHAAEILRLRELLDEIGTLAANAPEDGDSFGLLEEIAMRIAAADVPDDEHAAGLLTAKQERHPGREVNLITDDERNDQ